MFAGDSIELRGVLASAVVEARRSGHARVGSEHLLWALAAGSSRIADVLARCGIRGPGLAGALTAAAPWGAGAAADRQLLGVLGIELDPLLGASAGNPLDRPVGRQPWFPLGAARSRARCARLDPPLGLDAQAAYGASLRLALARRERRHDIEHLALVLVALDPGVAWVLARIGVDRSLLLAELVAVFPAPRRHAMLRVERRLGRASRRRDLVRRYQRSTGRMVVDEGAVAALIAG